MKRNALAILLLAMTLILPTGAMAHSFWINLNESYSHPPGHAMISLGFGHVIPLDDFLSSPHGTLKLKTFDLVAPDGSKTAIDLPKVKMKDPASSAGGTTIQVGDLGIRKLTLTDKTIEGTYQVAVTSEDSYFTMYLDKKGKEKMAGKPMDKVKGMKTVLASIKFTTFAKSYTAVKTWTDPKPLGHLLEIMPTTDLSNVHAGDLVPFEVTFMGQPFSCGKDSIETITANSNTYGGPDGFVLSAYLINGKGQFRIPTAGQWVVNVYARQEVKPGGPLDDLKDKCTTVYYAATISFTVKP